MQRWEKCLERFSSWWKDRQHLYLPFCVKIPTYYLHLVRPALPPESEVGEHWYLTRDLSPVFTWPSTSPATRREQLVSSRQQVMASQSGGLGHTGPSARGLPSCPVCGRAVGVRQSDDGTWSRQQPLSWIGRCPSLRKCGHPTTQLLCRLQSIDGPLRFVARRAPTPHPHLRTHPGYSKNSETDPRGARDAVAAELQSTLNTVLERPEDPQSWVRLWSFAEGGWRRRRRWWWFNEKIIYYNSKCTL